MTRPCVRRDRRMPVGPGKPRCATLLGTLRRGSQIPGTPTRSAGGHRCRGQSRQGRCREVLRKGPIVRHHQRPQLGHPAGRIRLFPPRSGPLPRWNTPPQTCHSSVGEAIGFIPTAQGEVTGALPPKLTDRRSRIVGYSRREPPRGASQRCGDDPCRRRQQEGHECLRPLDLR